MLEISKKNRSSIKIAGHSGMGLLTVGEIAMKALKKAGYCINSDREYQSLIQGGFSNSQIDFSSHEIASLSSKVDVLVALEKNNLFYHLPFLKSGGVVIHAFDRHKLVPQMRQFKSRDDITVIYLPARKIAHAQGGNDLVMNMVVLGFVWGMYGLEIEYLLKEVEHEFAHKPQILEIDLKCVRAGYSAFSEQNFEFQTQKMNFNDLITPKIDEKQLKKEKNGERILIDGTQSVAIGAIHAGVKAYYAYPMSPSSGILTYLAKKAAKTGMLVKQAEDEITAAQMAMGSMYAGCRALVATSGGGFDLMTETVSLAGIVENPLVIVVGQRPGPGTGLPTWTAQGDLNLAIHAGHGEFARLVIGLSDAKSSFELIQHAFNYAEKFQIPVIVLSEKLILETKTVVDKFQQNQIPIERGLIQDQKTLAELSSGDRYKITDSGLSSRWLPGEKAATYFANGDEHWESGELTEEAKQCEQMYAKRNRKAHALREALPEPQVFGDTENADVSLVGWGGVKNAICDAMKVLEAQGLKANYLHFDYLWPLKTEKFVEFAAKSKKLILVENNYQGQLGQMLEGATKVEFAQKILKFDGRPFFYDELLSKIASN
jgi:2-oxoglutarate ferredoxin oxidoreductase subunit alpha